jgi:hypothetical protein
MFPQNGGTAASPIGLGAARVPRRQRSIVRPRRPRNEQISKTIAARQHGQGQAIDPGFTPPDPTRIASQRPRAAVSGAVNADLGKQLSRRVSAGAVSQAQASQVARDRQLLEKAFGPDWRVKVFGDRGYVQRTRRDLARDPGNPQVKALYGQLMGNRRDALQRAKAKLAGGAA